LLTEVLIKEWQLKSVRGQKMFRTTIVVWLVLLVLALNVVTFVTRIAEKYRLANRLSKCSKEPILSYIAKNR
jgi:hypothetical protein